MDFQNYLFFLTFRCISQAEKFGFPLDLINNKLAQFLQLLPRTKLTKEIHSSPVSARALTLGQAVRTPPAGFVAL